MAYIVLFAIFVQLRTLADDAGMPVHFGYAIELERALAFGAIPSEWLQAALHTPGRIAVWEWYLTLIYASYFAAPHLLLFAFWRWHRATFVHALVALLLTFYLGLALAALIPTAPPWLAAESGEITGVARLLPEFIARINGDAFEQGHRVAGGNEVAAMPSLHMAITVVAALVLWRSRWQFRAIGPIYAASMGFALVYLGEHYAIDVVAGTATALVAWKAASFIAELSRLRETKSTVLRPTTRREVNHEAPVGPMTDSEN
jgi:membrane-associated phospholipid phosphatase